MYSLPREYPHFRVFLVLGNWLKLLCVEENVVPWNQSYFPQSMRNLPPQMREKAIEIANALLAQGYEEGKSIRIGIAQAKRWVGHGMSANNNIAARDLD
jgi:hypothetical protein